MHNLRFVIHSSTGQDTDFSSVRPKRAKHACQACQVKKVRCSGTQPCEYCRSKGTECTFKDGANSNAQTNNPAKRRRSAAPNAVKNATAMANVTHPDTSTIIMAPASSTAIAPMSSETMGSKAIQQPSNGTVNIMPNLSQGMLPPNQGINNNHQAFMGAPKVVSPAVSTTTNSSTGSKKGLKGFKTTRQPFFRWLGPTAIAPPKDGTYRLISVNLRSNEPSDRRTVLIERQDQNHDVSAAFTGGLLQQPVEKKKSFSAGSSVGEAAASSTSPGPESSVSNEEILPPLPTMQVYEQFFDNMANYLPFWSHETFLERVNQEVVPECLLYAIAALAEKLNYATEINNSATSQAVPGGNKTDQKPADVPTPPAHCILAERYLEAAKRLVIPHLASPSVEIVFTLLLIAYGEFGEDRDSGLWAWSGMAIRMCYDLGLHKASKKPEGEGAENEAFSKRVFWSVVCLDRIICCGTGRTATIPDHDIEHEIEYGYLPDGRTDPFPYLCKLFQLLGRVSNYLNSDTERAKKAAITQSRSSVSPSSLSPESWDTMDAFTKFQQEASDFYTELPPDLLFDVRNFQQYSKIKQSQVFLLLHIWNQALVLAVHHPTLVYPQCQLDVMGLLSNPHAELTGTGAISIADMVSFADLIEPNSFMANPFLSQPIQMAAIASLTLLFSLPQTSPAHSLHILQRTYNSCRQILTRMQQVWRGISWHSRMLDSLAASEPDVDLSVDPRGYINTRDLGVVRKASVDETTRQWLADRISDSNAEDFYGLFIAGMTDANKQYQQGSVMSAMPQSANSAGTMSNLSPSSSFQLGQVPSSASAGAMNDLFEDDSFKSMLFRNLELQEFFKPRTNSNDNELFK
ncbi:hypothetical protein TRVA0_029S00496 [Trichomonascus vanleenenianus]|uniref:Zn(II)2Cys6 transcription factor n=1 Tax=Trichomonascus vanleenenianus TaxID=2268995 RepID=UPI003ECA4081